jgi:hypothetical protein
VLAALLDDELELAALELDEDADDLSEEDFSVDFGVEAGLSDDLSEEDFSDDEDDSLLPEPLMVLLAESRLSLR